jgi:hypothetical protein
MGGDRHERLRAQDEQQAWSYVRWTRRIALIRQAAAAAAAWARVALILAVLPALVGGLPQDLIALVADIAR